MSIEAVYEMEEIVPYLVYLSQVTQNTATMDHP